MSGLDPAADSGTAEVDEGSAAMPESGGDGFRHVDYLVVTVLAESELRATLCTFGISPNRQADYSVDSRPVYTTTFRTPDGREVRIGITSLLSKGNVEARFETSKLLEATQPQQAFLVGTAAGLPDVTSIGDVVVATEGVHYYEKNHALDDERQRPVQVRPPKIMSLGFSVYYTKYARDHGWPNVIEESVSRLNQLSDDVPRHAILPELHTKAIASGEKIVQVSALRTISQHNEQVVAADQEAYGFSTSCDDDGIPWMIIRGVSDFGDRETRKTYALYASVTAASFLYTYLDNAAAGGRLARELPREDFFVRVAIGELTKQGLRRQGIELSVIGRVGDSSAKDIAIRLSSAYPHLSQSELRERVNRARAEAFDQKYKEPSPYIDERDLDRGAWEAEIESILTQLGPFDVEDCELLDVGCSNGKPAEFFIGRFQRYHGVDIASSALGDAMRNYPSARFTADESESLQRISPTTVDLYLSLRTYQSSMFSVSGSLLQAFRVLKSGGSILISIPRKYATANGVIEGLKLPGSSVVDYELPYRRADYIRQRLHRFGFLDIGIRTGTVEIFIWAHKPLT